MKKQQNLRKKAKLAKIESDFSYKQMAQIIGYNAHAFYNFLNGYYNLSEQKARQLQSLLDDLLD